MLFGALSRLGGSGDADMAVLPRSEKALVVNAAKSDARSRGLPVSEPGDFDPVCYAAAANSFVVRSSGELAKCTVALSHPENHVGWLREDGTMQLENAKLVRWMRGFASGDAQELLCPRKGYAALPGEGAGPLVSLAGPG
jgi:uncharacterized protein